MLALHDDRALATALARHARASRRIRLEIPSLVGDAELAREIERSIRGRAGVAQVVANARSGRVLIAYTRDATIADELELVAARAARPIARAAGVRDAIEWCAESIDAVARRLRSSVSVGLEPAEASARLDRAGANVTDEEAPASRLSLLADQLANVPTALLLGSTLVSLLLGDLLEAGVIVAVVGLNAAIGYHVERHSEDLLAAWRVAENGLSDVIRGGSIVAIPAAELVPGDVLVLRGGDVVNADARVIEAHGLAADEAALTGESEPVAKSSAPAVRGAPLAERASMLHRGSSIASGHGRAMVVATGASTEIACVQRMAAGARAPKGRLQRRLNALSSRLAWAGMGAAALSSLASLAWRRNPLDIVRDSVALGVAAIPEGLPVTATAALVRAMSRLRTRGIFVRRLSTAETLGGVTVACTDKTGTLTENRMRVDVVSILDDAGAARRIAADDLHAKTLVGPLGALLAGCVLNSAVEYQARADGTLELAGSPTERALVVAAQRAGVSPRQLRARWPRRRLIERSEGVHYVISEHDGGVAFVKGAPEQVIPLCALDGESARAALADNDALARDGLRVLAIAWRREGAWRYLGLVGLRDPLREGAADAIRDAARAGIRTIMLTGDQCATAQAIARQARLDGEVLDGRELAALLADPRAADRLRRVAVIARVTPADKVAVVEALRRHGEIVAMAGDGINDAPALRAADVGIAVGARSSDLARQTADVVLERADLRSILTAVAEGRAVQDNLRRSIKFQAAGNLGEILLVLGASLAGRHLISSMGLLWINLLTDTLPGLALALEPTSGDLLARPPVHPRAPILERADWKRVARDGTLIAAAAGVAAVVGGPLAAFGTIGATQFGYAARCRAADLPLRRTFVAMVGGSAALHALAVATAPARALLGIGGRTPLALATMAVGMGVPLYAAWRRRADHEIVRRGTTPDPKEQR